MLKFLLAIFMFGHVSSNCTVNNAIASCTKMVLYDKLPHNIKYLNLTNSCNFNVKDWTDFCAALPDLEIIKFKPYCHNCLVIDQNFGNLKIEGRCLERKPLGGSMDLSTIVNEVAGCLAFLIFLTILYLIKFIKKEILTVTKNCRQ